MKSGSAALSGNVHVQLKTRIITSFLMDLPLIMSAVETVTQTTPVCEDA